MRFVLVKELTSVKWLLSSRLMRVTDARHKITFSFIIQLTYVMCNSGWYGYVPYECNFL